MGRIEITLNDLENHLLSKKNSRHVEDFLNNFFEIGFAKKSHEVLDQNNLSNIIGINFSYDELVRQNNKTLYEKFLNFLKRREKYDDALFDIAENYYDKFKSYRLENINIFESYKNTFLKRSNLSDIVNKIDDKIKLYRRFLEQTQLGYNRVSLLFNDDLRKSIINFKTDKFNHDFIDNISFELNNLENENYKFFNDDFRKTIIFYETAIDRLMGIKEKILRYQNESNKTNPERYSSSEKIMREESDYEMSAMLRPSFMNYESFEEFKKTDEISSFEDIKNNIFETLFVSIDYEIYINFLAIKRIDEHYNNINLLKNSLGKILKK